MNDQKASQVDVRKQVLSLLLGAVVLLLVWSVSRTVAASDSVVAAALAGIPFGVGGGYLVAKAEAGEAIFILTKRWWWILIGVAVAIAAIDPAKPNRLLLAAMSGAMIVSYLGSFALFHLKLKQVR